MKRRKSILKVAACTLSILLITEGISGVPAIAFAADKNLVDETVVETDEDETVIKTEVYEAVVEADTEETITSYETVSDDAVFSGINGDASELNPDSALPEDGGDHVTGANTVIDKIGMEGYDPVTDDGMELYTAFYADLNLEIQGGRYFKGHEIIHFGESDSNASKVFALDEIPVEMSDNYMLFVDYYDYSGNPDGDLVYYLEKVTGTALYAWEYEKQTDGTYKRVRSVPISGEDFMIDDDEDTMYVDLGLGHIDTDKRTLAQLNSLDSYTAPKIYSYLSDHPDLQKAYYQHVPTLSGLVRLDGSAFKDSSNPIAIAAMCYDATATEEEDLYKTESGENTGGYTYHEYSWDNNAGFVATQAISYDWYYYGGDDNYTKYWSDEPYYASKMGSFSLRPYVYRFTDTGTEHILTLYHVTPYSLFVRKIEQGLHVFDNWKAADYSTANLPIDTWKIPATYTDPLSKITYKVRIAKGGNIVPHYASKLVIEDGVGFPDDCSYLFSSAAGINVNMRCLSEIVIEGNAKTVGSNIKNMSYMFLGKQGRQGFDATTYASLDFAALDTSNVTDMSFMFADVTMTNRANIDVTTLDTSKVTNFKGMFRSYHVPGRFTSQPATALDLSTFNTKSAEDMSEMFEGSTISSLDLSGFDFSKVTDISRMFTFTEYLESITFPSDMDSSKVTDMSFMFAGDYNLTQINNITAMDTGSVTDMSGMFGAHQCNKKLIETIPAYMDPEIYEGSYQYDKHLDGFAVFSPAWVTAKLYNVNAGPAITSLDLTGFDTRNVKYANGMFYMPNLTGIKWGESTTFEALSDAGGMFTLASVKKLDLTGRRFSNLKFASSQAFPVEMFNLNKATELVLGEDSLNLSKLSSKGQLMINAPKLYSLDFRHVEMGANALAGEGALYYQSPGSLESLSGLYEIYLPAGMPLLTSPAGLPGTFYDDNGEAYTVISGGYEKDLHLVNPDAEVTEDKPTPGPSPVTAVSIQKLKLTGFKSSLPYAGGAPVKQNAGFTYKYKSGKSTVTYTLVEGTDYTAKYENNFDLGTAKVTYEALKDAEGNYTGGFTGSVVKTFKITGKYTLTEGEDGNCTVTLSADSYPYTNAAIKPQVTVKARIVNNSGVTEERTLTQGKDYTVSYKNNKAVAAAGAVNLKTGKDVAPRVIIKGKGNYLIGSAKNAGIIKKFGITKCDISSLTLTLSDVAYNKAPGKYKNTRITLYDDTYRNMKLKAGKDYTVSYVTSGGSDTPAVGERVTVTLKATENNANYAGSISGTYRITDKTYTDISKAKVIINPNGKGKAQPCTYTGDPIRPGEEGQPVLKITVGSGKNLKVLTLNPDSEETETGDYAIIGYYNNINPGSNAVILIRGTGKYCGVRAVKFKIAAR